MLTQLLDAASGVLPAGPALLLVVGALVTLDALLPVLPSETAVVTAGVVVAASGVTSLPWLVAAAAVAALAGDVLSYTLGRTGRARWTHHRLVATRRAAALRYAQDALDRRGPVLVALARFVPGGRTAVTLSAGAAAMPRRRFVVAAALGAVVWAAVFATAGFVGGRVLADNLVLAVGVTVGLVLVVTLLVEALRRRYRGGVLVASP
jgi:membrane-associated protein